MDGLVDPIHHILNKGRATVRSNREAIKVKLGIMGNIIVWCAGLFCGIGFDQRGNNFFKTPLVERGRRGSITLEEGMLYDQT
jgi:hypothetical protein